MAQTKFVADISTAEFPLLTRYMGRTVLQPPQGEGAPPITHPQILFCQNVLPTKGGYKSVRYTPVYGAATPANIHFTKIFTVQDSTLLTAKVGITSDSKIYMLSATVGFWTDVTPVAWAGSDAVTMAIANGSTYLYLANFGCYKVSVAGVSLTLTALAGIVAANITGCFSSINYLCLFDDTHIYWCSTLNPLDFVPSIITGAGSAVPTDLDGKIVAVAQLNNGFAVYSTANIVLSTFSNNTQYPWIFVNANNGSGISSPSQLSTQNNLGFNIALTFAGVLQITSQGCQQLVPEISNFMAARLYESYNFNTDVVTSTKLDSNLQCRIAVIGARYVVLSYSVPGTVGYTDAIIRDLSLNRWGKITIPHAAIFEFDTGTISGAQTYINLVGAYNSYTTMGYNQGSTGLSAPPTVGNNFGILGTDGSVSILNTEELDQYPTAAVPAVLILGKYQSVRDYNLTLEEVVVESIEPTNTDFSVSVATSINGNTLLPTKRLTQLYSASNVRGYGAHVSGKNHTLIFKGQFVLTAVEITAVIGGRR